MSALTKIYSNLAYHSYTTYFKWAIVVNSLT